MKKLIPTLLLLTVLAFAGFDADLGLGATIMTEAESDCDYGWTGTVSSGFELFSVDLGTRLLGTIYYPEHGIADHAAMTGTVLGTIGYDIDSECGMEIGSGIQYRNEYARTVEEEEYSPVFYYGWKFMLGSGHTVRPFTMWTIDAERRTVQAGFLFGFGR